MDRAKDGNVVRLSSQDSDLILQLGLQQVEVPGFAHFEVSRP